MMTWLRIYPLWVVGVPGDPAVPAATRGLGGELHRVPMYRRTLQERAPSRKYLIFRPFHSSSFEEIFLTRKPFNAEH